MGWRAHAVVVAAQSWGLLWCLCLPCVGGIELLKAVTSIKYTLNKTLFKGVTVAVCVRS